MIIRASRRSQSLSLIRSVRGKDHKGLKLIITWAYKSPFNAAIALRLLQITLDHKISESYTSICFPLTLILRFLHVLQAGDWNGVAAIIHSTRFSIDTTKYAESGITRRSCRVRREISTRRSWRIGELVEFEWGPSPPLMTSASSDILERGFWRWANRDLRDHFEVEVEFFGEGKFDNTVFC